MKGLIVTVLTLYLVQYTTADGHGGASVCEFENWNWEECRQEIIDVANDREMFYFGKQPESCRNASEMDIDCRNMFGTTGLSIASILEIDPSLIDRYLNVTFPPSSADTYEYCDNKFHFESMDAFVLDPISDETHKPWYLMKMPNITWEVEEGVMYTLIIKDVGHGFIHGLYMNIHGNNLHNSTIIDSYSGPLNSRNVTNPYAFMLFKQNGTSLLRLAEAWLERLSNWTMEFNIAQFRSDLGLEGPVALNWIKASYDAYSLSKSPWIENCASFVQHTLSTHHITFMPEIPKLSVFMRVMFMNQYLEYEYCCTHHWADDKTFWLNPIGNGSVTPEITRTENPVYVYVNMNKQYPVPAVDFMGKMYTMLSVDPSIPLYKPTVGSRQYPLVHWLAVNGMVGPNGMLMFRDEIMGWRGPMPPDQAPHTYYFLLLEQKEELYMTEQSDLAMYSREECRETSMAGKCLFDVATFMSENDLSLVGASWMIANNSDYVNMTNKLEQSEETCGDRWPCLTEPWVGGANAMSALTALVMLALNLVVMVVLQ